MTPASVGVVCQILLSDAAAGVGVVFEIPLCADKSREAITPHPLQGYTPPLSPHLSTDTPDHICGVEYGKMVGVRRGHSGRKLLCPKQKTWSEYVRGSLK